ncbi:MAG: ribonuclease III [Lachnospiraceae bacterium]|nr:ribonuclease III [Lachnospiraceae bacterium]
MGEKKMTEWEPSELEERIDYRFHNEKLLYQALSHSSFANEHRSEGYLDNERLEFLGDAVLELISSDFLYHHYPDMQEGKLTKLRASLVCEPTLALCAKDIDLSSFLMLGRGEEHTGGRTRNSIVSDAMEALIGAIYLDGGMKPARSFIERFILTDIEHKKLFYDSKTVLQEIVQRDCHQDSIHYVIVGEDGPDHAKTFRAEVEIGGVVAGTGSGSTKKSAEQEAAWQAIQKLGVSGEKNKGCI